MNAEQLEHIARNPQEINAQQAMELDGLCRKFPWFVTPYVLLSHYYQHQGDYRTAETIQHAALRIDDRAFLHDFIHSEPKPSEISITEEEPIATETVLTTEQAEISAEDTPEIATSVSESPEAETAETITTEQILTSEPEVTVPDAPEVEEPLTEESESMIEPADDVYEEIEPFPGTESELPQHGFYVVDEEHELAGFEQEWDKLPDAGGLITPDTGNEETYDTEQTEIELPGEIMAPTPEKTETESEDNLKPKLIRQAAVYDIEHYFNANDDETATGADDFFSWLKNPVVQDRETAAEINEDKKPSTKDDLIDRFIKTNPSISRPQKDFFIPETAAKKSEQMPDNLATETLAKVYLMQQKPSEAIRIYERLLLKFPEKKPYFAALIEKTRKEYNL